MRGALRSIEGSVAKGRFFGALSFASLCRMRYSEAMIGRPENSEAASYYFTYINQIGKGDIVAILEQQLYETAALFASISEGTSLYRYAPDKWSLRQVMNHITDAERMFAFRALWFARGFEAPLPGFDQNIWCPAKRRCHSVGRACRGISASTTRHLFVVPELVDRRVDAKRRC